MLRTVSLYFDILYKANFDLQLKIVSFNVEPEPFARVDEGAKLEVVNVEVTFLLVTLAVGSTVLLSEAVVVVDWTSSPFSIVVGTKVVVTGESCLRAGCRRPAMARFR